MNTSQKKQKKKKIPNRLANFNLYNLLTIKNKLYFKTNNSWSRQLINCFMSPDEITIVYEDGETHTTYPKALDLDLMHDNTDWLQSTYPNGYIKPHKLTLIS